VGFGPRVRDVFLVEGLDRAARDLGGLGRVALFVRESGE
jgi:hypothetical protein